MSVKWTRDPQAEALLKEKGVKYRVVPGIKLSTIQIQESLRNNARLDAPIDDDVVEDFAFKMAQPNAEFPMPILHDRRGGYFVLSGNHRIGACEHVEEKTVDAYLVDCDDAMTIDDIIRTANRLHGKRQDRQEALRHAYAQVQAFNLSIGDAAAKFQVPEQRLKNYIRADKLRVKLQLDGVTAARDFTPGVLLSLGRLSDNDVVFRETAKAVGRMNLKQKEVDAFVDEVRHAPKEQSEQLATIGRHSQRLQQAHKEAASEAKKRPIKTQFTSKLRALLRYMRKKNPTDLAQLQITGLAEKQEVTHDIAELQAYLGQTLGGPRVPRNAKSKTRA